MQLIETLVKARKTETSDDVLIMRPDQRRPEAVLREMKAKGRGLKAKIEQRMEATRKAGGEKYVVPNILQYVLIVVQTQLLMFIQRAESSADGIEMEPLTLCTARTTNQKISAVFPPG